MPAAARLRRGLALAPAAALLAGCAATTAAPSPATGTATGAGRLVVTYEAARTPEDRTARSFLRAHRVLEDAAAYAGARIALPRDVPLRAASCEAPNPYWDGTTGRITYCYGLVPEARRLFARADAGETPDRRAAAVDEDVVGLSDGVLFHELGHALVDLYDLPVTGREEDAVDQLAVLLLASGDERHADYAISTIAAWGALWKAAEGGDPGVAAYSDVHSLDGQRFFNWACWLYGSDPRRFADAVDAEGNPDGVLPRDRAALCPAEFRRIDSSWRTLLAPHLKRP
ncbi:DUF4344 domain-containing metallopeptidase [Streptomyces griseus]|uniref:DUF4344 domain-containing metallopeptidase n=1 Tax=Streptomyces griseus TaxID=1911 RepID=UPI0004C50F7D|nr:DUF4344 domain-containing metallopeptidase [Streptomyces griseus]